MTDSLTEKKQSRSIRMVRLFALISVLIFIIWYMAFQFLSARNYAMQVNMTTDSLFREKIGNQFAPPVSEDFWENLVELEKLRAFRNARLEMAQSDSVRLIIHLPDSTLRLEIKSLVVYTAQIKDYKVSPSLLRIPHLAQAWWLSRPFRTTRNSSTIPREPIVIKHAPADTIEAQNFPLLPPEPNDKIVYFTYKTNRNLTIHVNQWEEGKRKGYMGQRIKRDFNHFWESLGYMFKFRHKPFQQRLEITIDKKDAKTIYRALPEFPQIAIKLNN